MPSIKLILLVSLVCLSFGQTPEDDEITQYFQNYPHKIYSGYLLINYAPVRKSIHYVYYESQRDHQKDPLILWLTGGPGCSGLAEMMHEHGPLRIQAGSTGITLNDNAWNKRANLLYFQLPSGVGFSQKLDQQTIWTDQSTSDDAMRALRVFFARFSSLKKNQFLIASSGYGANFASYLAKKIIEQNQDPFDSYLDDINLKGLIYGNPCMYPGQCYSGIEKKSKYHYEFLHKRGFIPKSIYYDYLARCTLELDPYDCFQSRQGLDKLINGTNTSQLNIYNKCYKTATNAGCQDEEGVNTFFNSKQFQQKWNIIEGQQWSVCNNTIWNKYLTGNGSYHILPLFHQKGIKMWIYSGDMDSLTPIIGTKFWLHQLKTQFQIPVKRNWREWWIPGKHKHEDQVGGFIWELEGVTFVSVKGAGFKAAQDQPVAMEQVINGFIDGKTLPFKTP